MKVTSTEKNSDIQIIRALAIMLVVFQHTLSLTYEDNIVAGFVKMACYKIDVTTFFFISGFLFQMKESGYQNIGNAAFLMNKAKQLLVPYLFWNTLIHVLVWAAYYSGIDSIIVLVSKLGFKNFSMLQIARNLLTYCDYHVEIYWFIYVLFLVFVMNKIFCRQMVFIKVALVESFILFVLALTNIDILNKIALGGMMFLAGECASRIGYNFTSIKCKYIPVVFSIFTVIFFIRLPNENHLISCIELIRSVVLGLCGVELVACLAIVLGRNNMLREHFEEIGNESFSIYLLHTPYIIGPLYYVTRIFLPNSFVCTICVSILGIVLPVLIDKLMSKTNLRIWIWCMGKA